MTMYKVIGKTKSRALRVMWMLNEIGEPYEQIKVAPRSDEAKRHLPTGTLPALVDANNILTDSVAIMTYLADKHDRLTAPAGTVARARQDAMTLWLIDEMDTVLRSAARFGAIEAIKNQSLTLQLTLKGEFAEACQTLSSRLEGPFLMGNTITVPDILAGHCLNWASGGKFARLDSKLIRYAKTLRNRPAFRAALAS